ncbi:MAG TPA: flagellin hook IN motif-containing protein [Lacipirellulaceae bacterium]|nr:flagellin hook IN motif-containing protein [Lacipirellulaceae bacterium]
MRIGASSTSAAASLPILLAGHGGSPAANELLIRKFAGGISVGGELADRSRNPEGEEKLDRDSVLARINLLVETIQKTALQSSLVTSSGASAESATSQRAIDAALQEIGRLTGLPLQPGGARRAVVSGLNKNQIESYEVISLRPNATLTLSGSVHAARRRAAGSIFGVAFVQQQSILSTEVTGLNASQIPRLNSGFLQPGTEIAMSGSLDVAPDVAKLVYEGAVGASVAGTASFRLNGPQGSTNLSVTSGEALSEVAERINDRTNITGILAAVQGNSLTLSTIATGAAASLIIDNVDRERIVTVSGANGSQVDNFQVLNTPDETQVTLNGIVTQAAARASLTYLGGPGGVVVDSATFTLSGDLGSAAISIVQGESLSDVADRINQQSAATGVSASVSGDNLNVSSANVGSAADVAVELNEIAQYLDVSGVNPSQITNFQVVSADPDSVNTLSGSVTQAATAAQLTYTGIFGRVTSSATFTLSGSLGSTNISVTALEALTAVRDRINLRTATTGVTASVSGNNLFLTSTGVGSAATVARIITSGTFNVTGGNGNGTANGTNAQLQINGQPIVAQGNNVAYTDALGSYTFILASGFTGAFNPITITSANGTFDVIGGNGDGTATGADAQAVINGQSLAAIGNTFSINTGGGQFLLELVDGFSGTLDPIDVESSFADFTITGGNGDRAANGIDAQATINGQSYTSATGNFTVPTPGGNLVIGFGDGFLGPFDPFTVTVREQKINLGTKQPSSSPRRAATATINGRSVKQNKGRFVVSQNGVEVALKFAPAFRGKFDAFTISAAAGGVQASDSPLAKEDTDRIRKLIEPLLSLASGGENAGLSANSGRAIRLATDALHDLAVLRFGPSFASYRSLASASLLLDAFA